MSKLLLPQDIYSVSAINKAINDFAEVATINMCLSKKHYICDFIKTIYDPKETISEFENYLIDLSNQMGL